MFALPFKLYAPGIFRCLYVEHTSPRIRIVTVPAVFIAGFTAVKPPFVYG
jgi:hypothetical protein